VDDVLKMANQWWKQKPEDKTDKRRQMKWLTG
jgi:hypothetical protein